MAKQLLSAEVCYTPASRGEDSGGALPDEDATWHARVEVRGGP